jgi:hypothetical protein
MKFLFSRTTPESTKYLSTAMDMFFTLCDDHDADVRMIADESLNKVIRNVSESQLGRVQVCFEMNRVPIGLFVIEESNSNLIRNTFLPLFFTVKNH